MQGYETCYFSQPRTEIVKLDENQQGCDYVITDIHGHLELLEKVLKSVDFNKDRLFICGDICDRNQNSAEVINRLISLKKGHPNNLYIVLGNHENLFLGAMDYLHKLQSNKGKDYNSRDINHFNNFLINGGGWIIQKRSQVEKAKSLFESATTLGFDVLKESFEKIFFPEKSIDMLIDFSSLEKYEDFLKGFPYIIQVGKNDSKNPFIICHADLPFNPDELQSKTKLSKLEKNHTTWARPGDLKKNLTFNPWKLYTGHNNVFFYGLKVHRNNFSTFNLDVATWHSGTILLLNHTKKNVQRLQIQQSYQLDIEKTINATINTINIALNRDDANYIDKWLTSTINQQNLPTRREKKKCYLDFLKEIIDKNYLSENVRKQLIFYLLAADKHLLKEERGDCLTNFFIKQFDKPYSNETLTMHKVINLLAESQPENIIQIDNFGSVQIKNDTNKESTTLTRHPEVFARFTLKG